MFIHTLYHVDVAAAEVFGTGVVWESSGIYLFLLYSVFGYNKVRCHTNPVYIY